MAHAYSRQGNLLGAFSLAVMDGIRAEVGAVAPSAGEGPAALVALTGFLEGASIEQLSRVLGLSHSASVRMVDKLEREGMVKRREGLDRRTVSLIATAKGRRVAARIHAARLGVLEEFLAPLSSDERSELTRLHQKLLAGVVGRGEAPTHICRLCEMDACGHAAGRCPVTEAAR